MGYEDQPTHNIAKKYKLVALGLIFHFLLLFAVFDIYFSSPIDHGMKHIKSTTIPPAKRLVIFVADGLRAEAVLGYNMYRIPFLKSVTENSGSWGVAHTRVPTESRPGHVAILAGIYEDPSAILKGWKANPVHFDSIINQSSNAWAWGSPDILEIFNRDNLSHIHLDTYSADLEDFGGRDTGILDMWVFNRVERFLQEEVNKCSKGVCDTFNENGNVFFLHLLGIDTAGHGYKPHSKEYVGNIQLVDKHVRRISALFTSVFGDEQTAFVFTADHGMTDWGSHGAGSTYETEAPLIAWGAGIKQYRIRQDVKQIDIAPLLASLIGINIPSNSLGVVPLQYLNVTIDNLAEIQLSNTLQLLELFNIKRLRIEANALIFIPYKGLSSKVLEDKVAYLRKLQKHEEFDRLIHESKDLVQILLNGLDYYHNYYQYPLLISISAGFIGWILSLLVSISENKAIAGKSLTINRNILIGLNAVPSVLCYKQKYPLSYYMYFTFPFAVFTLLLDVDHLSSSFKQLKCYIGRTGVLSILTYIVGIELLVYGFFNRIAFSLLSVLIGVWVFSSDSFGKYAIKRDRILWLTLCIVMSIFPLFPVMKTIFSLPLYIIGAASWILLFCEMYWRLKFQLQFRKISIRYRIFHIQFICLILACIYSISLEFSLISTSSSIKFLSWLLLIIPISLIPFSSTYVAVRLIGTFFGFAPFYLLVSSNFEAIFSAIHVAALCIWLLIETKTFSSSNTMNLIYYITFDTYKGNNRISADMFRRAFLFMVFIFLGFFGTGNIASLNSFDPMWVRAFLTVFSPFKMTGLILLKIIVPFLYTCCIFRAINSVGKENISQMFCIILIFSDLMVLQFLFMITNVGSWLDIGSSLSHFIIMEGFVIILLLLYGLAHFLTTASYSK